MEIIETPNNIDSLAKDSQILNAAFEQIDQLRNFLSLVLSHSENWDTKDVLENLDSSLETILDDSRLTQVRRELDQSYEDLSVGCI